jgi:TolB-like protein/DNA-binding winged helix-turn-helix (wHTH) protein
MRETVKLGEDFELDLRLHELRRDGRVLKLERIPMELLILLVDERERVVSRQQIVEKIWGAGIFLDTDNSINCAIRKVRQALRDRPERPRFIQTVTGKGYRFIAPVISPATEPPLPQPQIPTADARSRQARRWVWAPLGSTALILIAAALTYLAWFHSPRGIAPLHRKIMLAVLPFENVTGDAAEDYFGEGFTDEMISRLSRLDPQLLGVIARSSVMPYQKRQAPLEQIARELGVGYVLEGSIRRSSSRVLITAHLIQTKDRTELWTRDYNRDLRDLLTVQAEIAQEIADEIHLTLAGRRQHAANADPAALSPDSYEAHDLYLKGRYFWDKRTLRGFNEAVQCFEQAIAKDSDYAPAYAGLADSYAMMSDYGFVPAKQFMPKARTAALRALELDQRLADAHTSLAAVAENYDWDWKTAEKEYRRAIELNPNYATAHQWYGELLALEGRFNEALAESEQARQLDPLSLIVAADNGAILYFSRQYGRAIKRFRGILDLDPGVARAHMLIEAYVQNGQFKDALADIETWRRANDGPWIWAFKAYVYGRAGERLKAQHALLKLKQNIRASQVDPVQYLNLAYAGLNDKEKWLACLQEAGREHSNLVTAFKVDPNFDPLRNDPRFQDLLRHAGLKP